ncbi:MAG TPA: family 16 glycoside hydrolase [Dictyobacter sp.]|jgi:hypothetical protein|nr:family 16 glycoside hydrolase [Dictyobacter sp.]
MESESRQLRKHKNLALWIALCAVLLVSSSVLFAARMEDGKHVQPLVQRSVTPQEAIPSACGIHLVEATPTATVSPTPTLTPPDVNSFVTPTPTPIYDDTTITNRNGWATGNADGYTRIVNDDQLYLCDTNHHILTESLPTSAQFSNFVFSTTFTFVKADADDAVGVYLRGDNTLDHDYRVTILGNGQVSIHKEYLSDDMVQQAILLGQVTKAASLAPPGHANTLTVIMNGPLFTVKINGATTFIVADNAYQQGQIVLYVRNATNSNGVAASFRNVQVDPIPSTSKNDAVPPL